MCSCMVVCIYLYIYTCITGTLNNTYFTMPSLNAQKSFGQRVIKLISRNHCGIPQAVIIIIIRVYRVYRHTEINLRLAIQMSTNNVFSQIFQAWPAIHW